MDLNTVTFYILLGLTIFNSILLLVFLYRVGNRTDLDPNEKIPSRNEMKKHLIWKVFYCNPEDPRGWVPKLYGIGWTVNFPSKRSVHIFTLMILLTLFFSLGLVYQSRCLN